MFGNHGLGGLLEEGAHEKSPKCLGGNLGDFGEFCKGLGLPIVSVLERNIDSNRVGSLSAALLSLCGQTARLLSCGNFNQMTLQGQQGEVLLMQISDDLALVSTTKAGSRMGLVLVQLRRTVEEIRRHLGYMESAA